MKKILFLFVITQFALLLAAQEKQKFLSKAGKLVNSEAGEFKTGMVILVSNNMIDTVKAEKDLTAAEKKNYSLIDLSLPRFCRV